MANAPAEKRIVTQKPVVKQPVKKEKNIPSKKSVQPVQTASKKISTNQVIAIAAVAIGFVLILLIASGAFDGAPEGSTVTNTVPQQNQSPTVDLSTVQEINNLEEKVKANPKDAESLVQLAHLRNDSGMYDQAIQSYRKYLELKPEDADARVDMGVCYYNLKDYTTAIAEMKKALEYKPKHQIAHLNLGIVNLTAGNLNDSKEWFRKALEIDPNTEVGQRAKELVESHK